MNAYLKKSVAIVVAAMALGMAGDTFATDSTTGPEWMETIHVLAWDNPYDVANDAFDWTIADYNAWDVGVSDNGGNEGGGGPPPESLPCAHLRQTKPASCPNPIAFPVGYNYGQGQYAGGSGLPKLLYWIHHQDGVGPAARQAARNGLAYHTSALANGFISLDRANESLLLAVHEACQLQTQYIDGINVFNTGLTASEIKCVDLLERLQAEAGDPGFRSYFFDWLNREGLALDDLGIPETLINTLSPSNSLQVKFNMVTADAQCSKWWTDVTANQCSL